VDIPEKADDYKSTAGAEERRGPIVMMVEGGEEIPGPLEFDLETESAAHGKVRIPDLNDLSLAEILDHDWHDQLGWYPERTLEASNKDEPAEVDPQAAKGLEALTVDEIGEIQRRNRFDRNGGNAPSLAGPSLVEQVAVTLLQERPEREPSKVLKEVKRSILNLRLDYRENFQLALQANLAKGAPEPETSEGIESTVAAAPVTFEAQERQRPAPSEYLVDDPNVIRYVFDDEMPTYPEITPKARKEARRQIRDRVKKFEVQDGRLFHIDKPPARQNQTPGPVQKRLVLTGAEKEEVLHLIHDRGGHPSMPNTRKLTRDRFWWRNMYNKVGDYVRQCHNCQMTNQSTTLRTDGRSLVSTEVDLPMGKVGFDLLDPFPETPEGYKYVMVWQDYFSGWVGAGLSKSKYSKEVASFLKLDLSATHLCPATVVMDNNAAVGKVKKLCDAMGT
jgi:hypothetical protein